MHYFEPTILSKALLVIAIMVALGGCASSAPSALQWWRVGDCLVLYDEREANRHMVVAGQQCDIKRQDLTNAHGVTRAPAR
jgi:hypothetical protein